MASDYAISRVIEAVALHCQMGLSFGVADIAASLDERTASSISGNLLNMLAEQVGGVLQVKDGKFCLADAYDPNHTDIGWFEIKLPSGRGAVSFITEYLSKKEVNEDMGNHRFVCERRGKNETVVSAEFLPAGMSMVLHAHWKPW